MKSQKYLHQWRHTDRKSYVSLAQTYLEFLSEITKYPSLVDGCHLRNAIRRYELFWLPLCRRYGTMSSEDWAPPLDIAWVWYLHMAIPASYVDDCIHLIGNAPSHRLKSGILKEKALLLTKDLWDEAYASTKEPFSVDLTVPCTCPNYNQKLPHDFYHLSRKHRNFCYQVSLPHYSDDTFLDAATERYVIHLDLQMKNPSFCLSLPVDVQLIMQTHQLNPIFYQYQIGVILGKVANYEYDFLLDCKTNIDKRYKAENITRALWKETGQDYAKPGTTYRGDIPVFVEKLKFKDYGVPIEYDVSVTKIELIPLEYYGNYALMFTVKKGSEISKTKIKIEQGFASKHRHPPKLRSHENGIEYVQLEDFSGEKLKSKAISLNSPRYSLLAEELTQDESEEDVLVIGDGIHALMNYKTNAARSTKVEISLLEIDKNKSASTKSCIGRCHLDVFQFVRSDDNLSSEETKQKLCLPLEFPSGCPSVRLTLVLAPIRSGCHAFQVSSEEYGLAKFAHIGRALSYPTLMLPLCKLKTSDAAADAITYPIKDCRGKENFSCRIVRSTSDLFYAIEIIDKEGATIATSHLLSNNTLPLKGDLFSCRRKAFFLADELQYAMIIRGQEDWGVCYGQQLHLSQSLPFFGLKLFLSHEQANEFCYVHKYRGSLYMFTLSATEKRANDAHIYLHLAEGKVVITGNLREIPEILAFLMSALVLRYIFCEKEEDCWTLIDREGVDLLSIFQGGDDVGLLWDGIYEGEEACIAAYRAVVSNVDC